MMELDHLRDIHPIDVIGAEDCHQVGLVVFDEIKILVDGVGGTLIPTLAETHLGRHRQ